MVLQLKICGLTQPAQAAAVAQLGADAIGVIAVERSPRYLNPSQRPDLWQAVATASPATQRVLVVVNPSDAELEQLEGRQGHQVVQLHGEESPERCRELRDRLKLPLWKALRIRSAADLQSAARYSTCVDGLLLDAWSAGAHGGTGQQLPLQLLGGFGPDLPWWLAGGISPATAASVLEQLEGLQLHPCGLDASSGVETAPGTKDLQQVAALMAALKG